MHNNPDWNSNSFTLSAVWFASQNYRWKSFATMAINYVFHYKEIHPRNYIVIICKAKFEQINYNEFVSVYCMAIYFFVRLNSLSLHHRKCESFAKKNKKKKIFRYRLFSRRHYNVHVYNWWLITESYSH